MADPEPPPRYRRPSPQDLPDPITVGEQAEFDAMSATSTENVTASAERWRNGLAGLTTVITGGLLLKGPADAADLDLRWLITLTALFGLGIAASVGGLWFALRAAAGVPGTVRFADLRARYGTVALYRLHIAQQAARDLTTARQAAIVAAVLLTAAILGWWWAPAPTNDSVTVTSGTTQSCGTIVDSDAGGLRLSTKDSPTRVTIPWASVTTIRTATSC